MYCCQTCDKSYEYEYNMKLHSDTICEKEGNTKTPTIIETFVGCGGAHLGFKQAGFKTIFVNDIWSDALQTLKDNNSELKDEQVVCEDINNLDEKKISEITANHPIPEDGVDVLMGGVVCKGFSLAGVRNPFDERNYLYLQQLRLVKILRPKISVIENVPGMLSMKILKKNNDIKSKCEELTKYCDLHKNLRGTIIALKKSNTDENTLKEKYDELNDLKRKREKLEKELDIHMYGVIDDIKIKYTEMGYTVHIKKLKCNEYSCATSRQRLFIVAIRNDTDIQWEWPKETSKDKYITVKNVFDTIDYKGVNSLDNDPDNRPMNHRNSTIEKFKKVSCDKKENNGYFSRGTSSRLNWNKPAPTLVPGHSSFQIHPKDHRSISVREGAMLTGFDKKYKFYGSHTSRCMQIGNAIPVNMAYNIAKKCKEVITNTTA